jgi:hypothetical protein
MARDDQERRLRHAHFQRRFRAEVRATMARLEAASIPPHFPVLVKRTWYGRAVRRPGWLLPRDGFRVEELADALTVDGELFIGAWHPSRNRFTWPDGRPAEPIYQRKLSAPGPHATVHTSTGLKLLAQLARVGVPELDAYNRPRRD